MPPRLATAWSAAAAALLAATTAGCAPTRATEAAPPEHPQPGDAVVRLVGNDFEPGDVTVEAGRRVVWQWTDGIVHNVVARGRFASKNQNGGSYAVRFDEPGRYSYTCTLHRGMDGTVTVTPPAEGPAPAGATEPRG